ncbi:DUF742 domain-containing protein [Streptomyces sp. NPDC058471]|uniref:DUF742 domain-containing protein n=1 Tax=Streptomyces sp. NPDC058471 TaxID=3346516 RepID=UPI003653D323
MAAAPDRSSWTRESAEAPAYFILTGGQTATRRELKVETQLTATEPTPPTGQHFPEAETALALCRGQPSSVAEIAALLSLPVQITKVLLDRLIDTGALAITAEKPRTVDTNIALLEAVLAGLHGL